MNSESPPAADKRNILVILQEGLREFVMATGAFEALRRFHKQDTLTLLTTAPYQQLAEQSGCFDHVVIDPMPDWINFHQCKLMWQWFRNQHFDRVYDLQNSLRTHWYFRLCGRKKPEWCGTVDWCSHPYTDPDRFMHPIAHHHVKQLAVAGIERIPKVNVSWLHTDIAAIKPEKPFVLILPGGHARQKEMQWHVDGWVEVVEWLDEIGYSVVCGGFATDRKQVKGVLKNAVQVPVMDLGEDADFVTIASLAREAALVVGHDAGLTYLAMAAGAPTFFIVSSEYTNVKYWIPRSETVRLIQVEELGQLESYEVIPVLEAFLKDTENEQS